MNLEIFPLANMFLRLCYTIRDLLKMPNFGQGQVEDPELAAGEGKNFNHRNILNVSRIKI
jgi:hypothetical protein